MRLGRATKPATWIALVAWTLLALLPAGGLSVCLGADGHVGVDRLDTAAHACPCELADQGTSENIAAASADDHPPCQDIALEAAELFLEKSGNACSDLEDVLDAPPLLATLGASMQPAPPAAAGAQRSASAGAQRCLSLQQRGTIVLLI